MYDFEARTHVRIHRIVKADEHIIVNARCADQHAVRALLEPRHRERKRVVLQSRCAIGRRVREQPSVLIVQREIALRPRGDAASLVVGEDEVHIQRNACFVCWHT